jgi:hypothetical protein
LSEEKPQPNTGITKNVSDAEHQVIILRKRIEEFSEEGSDKLSKFEQEFSEKISDLNEVVNKFTVISKS